MFLSLCSLIDHYNYSSYLSQHLYILDWRIKHFHWNIHRVDIGIIITLHLPPLALCRLTHYGNVRDQRNTKSH